MDKYDEAVEFLKNVEPGSYFDECAQLIEELLARVHELENKPKKVKRTKEPGQQAGGWGHYARFAEK